MPWKVKNVSEVRFAACHAVRTLGQPVAAVARAYHVSRKTLHKWLRLFDGRARPVAEDLRDRSRRPHRSPRRTSPAMEKLVLDVRDGLNWGPRKIYNFLLQEIERGRPIGPPLPHMRTIANILRRHDRIQPDTAQPELQRFERARPNQLWQIDHKGSVEVQRRKVMPLSILDDHSRYCLRLTPCLDLTLDTVWGILWDLFGEVGLSDAILADNAFRAHGGFSVQRCPGLGWFDARLIRLGIRPLHGRPYHPQTQGKVERFHGSVNRELIQFNARRDCLEHFRQDCEQYRVTYNTLRPHEAVGDRPPVSRWRPSNRLRPNQLPPVTYPAGAVLRKVSTSGDIRYCGYRILCGRGITGQPVRVEESQNELAVFYGHKKIRSLPLLSRKQRNPSIML